MAKKQLKRKRIGVGEVIWFLILCLLAFLIIYPLCWILMSSFKDYQGIYGDVWGLPKKLLWSNYVTAWNKGISLYFVNSLIVTIATLIGVVFVASFAAFGVCQIKRKTRKLCVSVLPVRTSSFSAGMLTSAFYVIKDSETEKYPVGDDPSGILHSVFRCPSR